MSQEILGIGRSNGTHVEKWLWAIFWAVVIVAVGSVWSQIGLFAGDKVYDNINFIEDFNRNIKGTLGVTDNRSSLSMILDYSHIIMVFFLVFFIIHNITGSVGAFKDSDHNRKMGLGLSVVLSLFAALYPTVNSIIINVIVSGFYWVVILLALFAIIKGYEYFATGYLQSRTKLGNEYTNYIEEEGKRLDKLSGTDEGQQIADLSKFEKEYVHEQNLNEVHMENVIKKLGNEMQKDLQISRDELKGIDKLVRNFASHARDPTKLAGLPFPKAELTRYLAIATDMTNKEKESFKNHTNSFNTFLGQYSDVITQNANNFRRNNFLSNKDKISNEKIIKAVGKYIELLMERHDSLFRKKKNDSLSKMKSDFEKDITALRKTKETANMLLNDMTKIKSYLTEEQTRLASALLNNQQILLINKARVTLDEGVTEIGKTVESVQFFVDSYNKYIPILDAQEEILTVLVMKVPITIGEDMMMTMEENLNQVNVLELFNRTFSKNNPLFIELCANFGDKLKGSGYSVVHTFETGLTQRGKLEIIIKYSDILSEPQEEGSKPPIISTYTFRYI